jgi:probable HAF family extracellular repeat protein
MADLGSLGGTQSGALTVTPSGVVVGSSLTAGNLATHVFTWTPAGGMVDLGTLGGTSSFAAAVNPRGDIVGNSSIAGDTATHAVMFRATG